MMTEEEWKALQAEWTFLQMVNFQMRHGKVKEEDLPWLEDLLKKMD